VVPVIQSFFADKKKGYTYKGNLRNKVLSEPHLTEILVHGLGPEICFLQICM